MGSFVLRGWASLQLVLSLAGDAICLSRTRVRRSVSGLAAAWKLETGDTLTSQSRSVWGVRGIGVTGETKRPRLIAQSESTSGAPVEVESVANSLSKPE